MSRPQVWQRLPDISPNYGHFGRSKLAVIPWTNSERIVILRTNPGHERQLSARLVNLDIERCRTARQLDHVRHSFIEQQARKQRRLEDAGVSSAALLPAHLMLETDVTSLPQQTTAPHYEMQVVEIKARPKSQQQQQQQNEFGFFPPLNSTACAAVTAGSYDADIVKAETTTAASYRQLIRAESTPVSTKSVEFGDNYYTGSEHTTDNMVRYTGAVVVIPTGERDVTITSQTRHSVSDSSDLARIRKRALPSLIENIDAEYLPMSKDTDPRFVQVIDSLRNELA